MPKKLPKISIITPSYNQGRYIEQTIQSVINQDYPNFEYLVIDGGSTDATLQILKKYSRKLRWISQKDKGQSDAINKGLKMSTGEIIGYLNSDDILEKGSLAKVAQFFDRFKEYSWVTGKCFIINDKNEKVRSFVTLYKNTFLKYFRSGTSLVITNYISQPATFWKREAVKKAGLFNESLHYSMDYDFWLRLWKSYKLGFIDEYLASFRTHETSKTVSNLSRQINENYGIVRRYSNSGTLVNLHKFHGKIMSWLYEK